MMGAIMLVLRLSTPTGIRASHLFRTAGTAVAHDPKRFGLW